MNDEINEDMTSKKNQITVGTFSDNNSLMSLTEKINAISLHAVPQYSWMSAAASLSESLQKHNSLFGAIDFAKSLVNPTAAKFAKAVMPPPDFSAILHMRSMAEQIAKQSAMYQSDFLKSASFIKSFGASLPNDMAIRKAIGVTDIAQSALVSNFDFIRNMTSLANRSIASFAWADFGKLVPVPSPVKIIVENRFVNFAEKYSTLIESLSIKPEEFSEINPALSKLASSEYYTCSEVIESISSNEIIRDDEVSEFTNQISFEAIYNIEKYLPRVDTGLLKIWQSANEIIDSDKGDKVRYYITGIRELFTHLMHSLAPDEKIKSWSTNPEHFHQNRPTRPARLQYIYRNIKSKSFKEFVDADVKMTNALFGMFQEGTHSIDNPFSDYQLSVIRNRAQTVLSYVLLTHFSHNN